jgi:hypothetical protein
MQDRTDKYRKVSRVIEGTKLRILSWFDSIERQDRARRFSVVVYPGRKFYSPVR